VLLYRLLPIGRKLPLPYKQCCFEVHRFAPGETRSEETRQGGTMRFGPFLLVALLLLIMWAGGFLMFHVASGLIHLLLLFAVISFVAHLFTGARAA
jgi:hypothetical protein